MEGLFCKHGALTGASDKFSGCSICAKEFKTKEIDEYLRKQKLEQKLWEEIEKQRLKEINKKKREFEENPEKRFNYISQLGREKNYQTTYVIELSTGIRRSKSVPSYPLSSLGFNDTKLHTKNSRCFYVGQTQNSAEERFHIANVNHMERTTGKVSKHRLIKDIPPYTKSIKSLNELTESYGFENPKKGTLSHQFEHYVAWALYMCGHRTWGPQISELGTTYQDQKWLGEDPYV
tara:strand:+ start:219 stop:920 length:702 start_codon:yes stop_codon:yes gene_type:complete